MNGLSVHLVEASPALSTIQERTLQGFVSSIYVLKLMYDVMIISGTDGDSPTSAAADTLSSAIPYKTCTLNSHHGIQASWYQRLQDVPRGITCDHSNNL
jgi:hypothetical protein